MAAVNAARTTKRCQAPFPQRCQPPFGGRMSSRIKAIGAIAVFSACAISVHAFGFKAAGSPQNPVSTGPVGPPVQGGAAGQAPTAKPAPTPPPDPDGQVIK